MRTEFQGGPNGAVVQDHIDSFFKALQSFFHPSNLGKWNVSLSGHLIKGCVVFVSQRIIYNSMLMIETSTFFIEIDRLS